MFEKSTSIEAAVKKLAEPILERERVKLYRVEWSPRASRGLLRVYITKPVKVSEEGMTKFKETVSIDDCYRVSQALSLELDVADLIPHAYELEVSSPGLERKLVERWHFDQAVGEQVKLFIQDRAGQSASVTGTLSKVTEENLEVTGGDGVVNTIPFSVVQEARVVFLFGRDGDRRFKKNKSKKGK